MAGKMVKGPVKGGRHGNKKKRRGSEEGKGMDEADDEARWKRRAESRLPSSGRRESP
jgi:hypothetical protein